MGGYITMKLLLQKSIINHYYKKAKQRFSSKKIHKKLAQSQQAKKLGRFEIKLDNVWIANNKQIFAVKLLANLVVASDCYIVLNMFEHVSTFNIFHITWGINYNWLLLKAVNVLYVYVQFKRTNQSCSPSKISQSITIEWRTCDGNSK